MTTAFLKYIMALLLFGSNGLIASYIALSSYEIVLLRTLIGSLFLIGIFILGRGHFTFYKEKTAVVCLLISGCAMGASWMFLYEAYVQLSVSVASLCYYCGPMVVMVLSPVVFKEKLTAGKILGFCAVVLGIFLVTGPGAAEANPFGLACGLGSAVMYAAMVIFNKKAAAIKGLENAALQLLCAFLTVAVFVGIKQGYAIKIPSSSIFPVIFLGVVNTGLGCYLYFSDIGKLPVQTVAICGYLEPLSAVFLSVLILKETMDPLQWIGAFLIIGGAIFGECIIITAQKKKVKHI